MESFKYLAGCLTLSICLFSNCNQTTSQTQQTTIPEKEVAMVVDSLIKSCPNMDQQILERGVRQVAALWRAEDGSAADFTEFVTQYYAQTPEQRTALYQSLSTALEHLYESSNELTVELLKPTQLTNTATPTDIDYTLSAYSPMGHFSDDMFQNKLAFQCILNFPNYTLQEKDSLGKNWTRRQWAEARLGDVFTKRVPADVSNQLGKAESDAGNYITDYNIYMGHLVNDKQEKLWTEDIILLSHWNLRDELKANYVDVPHAQEKQEMIYQVMQRIVRQEIPAAVINSGEYDWNPISNQTYQQGKAVDLKAEDNIRYQHIMNIFHGYQAVDKYCPQAPTAIQRNFDSSIEIPAQQIKDLFEECISSVQVKQVAQLIEKRLGRKLRPYDIWYDGFKSRSNLPEDKLSAQTRQLYPDCYAFGKDMPRMLTQLGFSVEEAKFLGDRIVVEPARGSGHAWGESGHNSPARLRTRIGMKGMDYKGYNIAVHEFGHNVEQVTSLYHNDEYMLNGVPNTAFTEASAFMFQQRDLQLLGYGKQSMDDMATLDVFWNAYEIMGVSLVDIRLWEWLYAHPTATVTDLHNAVLQIATEVWNAYYAPVLGEKDSLLLAIYSHMVDTPMYLPNYPLGHIIHYQLEQYLAQPKFTAPADFAKEYTRIYSLGCLTPQAWMQQAVGQPISVKPILNSVSEILSRMN